MWLRVGHAGIAHNSTLVGSCCRRKHGWKYCCGGGDVYVSGGPADIPAPLQIWGVKGLEGFGEHLSVAFQDQKQTSFGFISMKAGSLNEL